jgi:hypothetical protein
MSMRATLAGIGATSIVAGVLTAIAFELWFDQVLVFPAGPRFEPIGLVSYAAGAYVATRVGGWRGVAGFAVFVAIAFGYKLLFWLFRGTPAPDLDFFVGPAWAFEGVALGVVLGRLWRIGTPPVAMLWAAGAYTIGRVIWAAIHDVIFASTWTGGTRPSSMDWLDLSGAIWGAGLGIVVGVLYGPRLTRWQIVIVAVSSSLASGVIVAHQGAVLWGEGTTWFLSAATGVIGGIGFVLGAVWTRRRAQPSSLGFASP